MSSYVPRSYEELVRDMLTTLTGGTVGESLVVGDGDGPLVLAHLKDRPVRRVSHVEGTVEIGGKHVPYRFTPADYEVVASDPQSGELDAISFRPGARRPLAGTTVSVNYYPLRRDRGSPLTDLNVGSVTRTTLETLARELALAHQQCKFVYDAAYLDSASGPSLDGVVALVGATRLPAGHSVVTVRLTREAGSTGRINIPANTAVTGPKAHRYLTTTPVTLEPGELVRDVLARGETAGTGDVAAGEIDRLEVLVAGIGSVLNPEPSRALDAAESDDALRARARSALNAELRGTPDALVYGVKSVQGVTAVTLTEAPEGVPGEVRIDVAYDSEDPQTREQVATAIDDFRAAGIRVRRGEAERQRVSVTVALTLAGGGPPAAELARVTSGVEQRLADHLSGLAPGATARRARMTALVLEDPLVVDARIELVPDGGGPVEELSLDAGQVLDVATPFTFQLTTEAGGAPGAAGGGTVTVTATLPLHLVGPTTAAQAQQALEAALGAHLATRGPLQPLTFDGAVSAAYDTTRYAIVRADGLLIVERAGQFTQLADGSGSYTPLAGEQLVLGTVTIDVRPGGVPA